MDLEQASKIVSEYKKILEYKKQMGFLDKWPKYEKFKAGDQWPPVTENTKNLPRPVLNIIQYIENHKICSVLNNEIKMVFTSSEVENEAAEEQADVFTKFSEVNQEKLKQHQLNEEALESASNLGTAIWHYYWDNSIEGGMDYPYIGDMRGEVIDPMDFFPGNPQDIRVQSQPYIIITSRDLISNIKKQAKENGAKLEQIELIQPDKVDTDYEQAKYEVKEGDKATVYTKYYKQDGFVWFTKVCSDIEIKPPTDTKMKLYPIAIMQWYKRKKCIFGIGDTEGIIPNQKAINFLIAMQILSVQLTGWPKLVYNPMFIKQKIYNTPGEIIENQDPNGNRQIDYLTPGNFAPQATQLVENIMEYTKTLSGATETSTGELSKSNAMNATAISLLQQAASIPIKGIRQRFYQAMEDIGLIWEQFWRVYYNTDRQFSSKNEDNEQETFVMNGENAKDFEFNLKIDVMEETPYTEGNVVTSLNTFLEKGNITFEQYLKYAPNSVVPFKEGLLRDLQKQKEQALESAYTSLTPEDKAVFDTLPPERQQQILSQVTQ